MHCNIKMQFTEDDGRNLSISLSSLTECQAARDKLLARHDGFLGRSPGTHPPTSRPIRDLLFVSYSSCRSPIATTRARGTAGPRDAAAKCSRPRVCCAARAGVGAETGARAHRAATSGPPRRVSPALHPCAASSRSLISMSLVLFYLHQLSHGVALEGGYARRLGHGTAQTRCQRDYYNVRRQGREGSIKRACNPS